MNVAVMLWIVTGESKPSTKKAGAGGDDEDEGEGWGGDDDIDLGDVEDDITPAAAESDARSHCFSLHSFIQLLFFGCLG